MNTIPDNDTQQRALAALAPHELALVRAYRLLSAEQARLLRLLTRQLASNAAAEAGVLPFVGPES